MSLSLFLLPYFGEPVLMFLMGILVGTVLEFVASLVMEKVFSDSLWDYSDPVVINTFPRMSLVADYSSATGIEPRSLKIGRRPGSPANTRPRISDRAVGDGRPSA